MVVDASVVMRLLQNRSGDERLQERFGRHRFLHAPALIDAEVASAVRGLLLTSKPEICIEPARAQQILEAFTDLPVVRYPMRPLQQRVLALRHNLTAYDAFYVALAESLQLPLLTADRKFDGAAGHGATIEVYP